MDSDRITFMPWDGPTYGLYSDENYLVFRWIGKGTILASVSRRGDAACAHLYSDKIGLRGLKQAINEFVEFALWLFDWCKMVLAQITKPSIERVVRKCGFNYVGEDAKGIKVYERSVWVA